MSGAEVPGTDAAPIEIRFGPGWSARAVAVPADTDGASAVSRLGIPAVRAAVAVTGGTADGTSTPELASVFVDGIGTTILDQGWTAVTGATDAGVFALLGRAAAAAGGLSAPWIGIAPEALVTWPGRPAAPGLETHPLEPHHSHFVLVDGREWGDETRAQLAVTTALASSGVPSAVVLAGGGVIARREIIGHARAGRPILVLRGSGRMADDLAKTSEAGSTDPDDLAEVVRSTRVVVCDVADGAAAVRRALLTLITPPGAPSPPPASFSEHEERSE